MVSRKAPNTKQDKRHATMAAYLQDLMNRTRPSLRRKRPHIIPAFFVDLTSV